MTLQHLPPIPRGVWDVSVILADVNFDTKTMEPGPLRPLFSKNVVLLCRERFFPFRIRFLNGI